ncbi:TPA: hypothetical protein MYO83_005573 [Klebsiella michiganensis]|nr:hypothetical protein [Klebsiella michiganensis]HCB1849080.1 hypothetical protein [Klebsiella oxytoca]
MDNRISINKIISDIKATKGNRAGCQGLHSSLESDGYITSICRWARATSPERIDALVEHVEKQDAALIAWEKTMMEACGEDGPASVAAEIRNLRALRDTALEALRAQVEQLAAENVGLRNSSSHVLQSGEPPKTYREEWFIARVKGRGFAVLRSLPEEYSYDYTTLDATYFRKDLILEWMQLPNSEFLPNVKTPATDRIVAGIKADGVEEFAKHCDDSIGFVEPEDEEFYTVMEEHASEFAKQLREGADK